MNADAIEVLPETTREPDDLHRERADRIVNDVLELGRLWVAHGLHVGKLALETSGKSAARAAELLDHLAEEIVGDPDADRAPTAPTRDQITP